MAFTGIPAAAPAFYEQLEADSSKAFRDANRETFTTVVRRPCEELCAALDEFGPFQVGPSQLAPWHAQ